MTRVVVVDRFEEGTAVLIPDDEDQPLHVPRAELPIGTREGDCLRVETRDHTAVYYPAPEETARRRERIRSKLDWLRSR